MRAGRVATGADAGAAAGVAAGACVAVGCSQGGVQPAKMTVMPMAMGVSRIYIANSPKNALKITIYCKNSSGKRFALSMNFATLAIGMAETGLGIINI